MLWLPFGGETGDYPINRREKTRKSDSQPGTEANGNTDIETPAGPMSIPGERARGNP
jgi:hypothetical protein